MRLVLPRLYVILDAGMLTEPSGETAQKLMDEGRKLLQYRAKNAAARELWAESRAIAEAPGRPTCTFLVNVRPGGAGAESGGGVGEVMKGREGGGMGGELIRRMEAVKTAAFH